MEIVVVKVRSSYGDKKLHVLRFVFDFNLFSSKLIREQLGKLFPYGFYPPKIERWLVDFAYDCEKNEFESLCNHDYLAKYLTSTVKNE